jgi:putative endonuclease
MSEKLCFCYMLECSDGTFYTGWTTDPARRLKQHNRGTGARYTRARRPVRLVYVEELPDRGTAMRREAAIKRMHRAQKKRLVETQGGDRNVPKEIPG